MNVFVGRWTKNALFIRLRLGKSIPRIILAVVLSLACVMLILYLYISSLLRPVSSSSEAVEIVRISPGMNAEEIGSLLADKGLIKSALMFRLVSRFKGVSRYLKAGEYALRKDMDMFQILYKIVAGETTLYRFTIPEGYTLVQIAQLWESKGFGSATDFISASRNPVILKKYNINSGSLEGYLFPDTYMLPRDMSEREAIDKMVNQFNKKFLPLMKDGHYAANNGVALSIHEIISLASIIEKEAKVNYEKPIISAVFYNRLRQGHKLESCATVLYSLGFPHRSLTESDLENTLSPYNTYIYQGLPPGPICSPGLVSILAAFNPSNDRYFYFVAKNDGTHYFAENYEDFLDAKRKYQSS